MHETPTELTRLQELLDDSIERASGFLRSSFEMPEHSLSARQLVTHLQGSLTVALGTVTARGEPRVAPINALFLHGSFLVPTVAEAARTRHLAQRPAASLTWFTGTELAVIAHGHVEIIGSERPEFAELDATQVRVGNQSVQEWSDHGVYLQLRAGALFSYARDPSRPPAAPVDSP